MPYRSPSTDSIEHHVQEDRQSVLTYQTRSDAVIAVGERKSGMTGDDGGPACRSRMTGGGGNRLMSARGPRIVAAALGRTETPSSPSSNAQGNGQPAAYYEFRIGDYQAEAVVDPFGNMLGIMYNPHYLEILGR
jgi:hypothetical protein